MLSKKSRKAQWNPSALGWNLFHRWNEIHPSAAHSGFHLRGRFHQQSWFCPPNRVDFVKKKQLLSGGQRLFLFWRRWRDLNPCSTSLKTPVYRRLQVSIAVFIAIFEKNLKTFLTVHLYRILRCACKYAALSGCPPSHQFSSWLPPRGPSGKQAKRSCAAVRAILHTGCQHLSIYPATSYV